MAQYLLLIYEDAETYGDRTAQEWADMAVAHGRFVEQVVARGGTVHGGEALQSVATATSVRNDVVTDGPFLETKEALGGYYLIEAADLDHMLALAKLCPAPHGGVEVRPIQDTAGR